MFISLCPTSSTGLQVKLELRWIGNKRILKIKNPIMMAGGGLVTVFKFATIHAKWNFSKLIVCSGNFIRHICLTAFVLIFGQTNLVSRCNHVKQIPSVNCNTEMDVLKVTKSTVNSKI